MRKSRQRELALMLCWLCATYLLHLFKALIVGIAIIFNCYFKTRQSSCMTARGIPPAPPPTSKSFQNVCRIFCPKFCPFFVQNFVYFLSKTLSILCWGGYPRGRPPSWGVPLGAPPQLGGGPPGVPPNWG